MDAQEYCKDVVRQAGNGVAMEVAMSPPGHRPAVTALCALRLTLAKIPQIEDPGVAHAKLQWWEDELDRLVAVTPRHPITKALVEHQQAKAEAAPGKALCAGLRRIIDRATDSSTLEKWLLEARSVGGSHAALATHYLKGNFDPAMSQSLGGIVEAARWSVAVGQPWLSAPADLRARFQVSNAMLRSPQPGPEVQALRAQVLEEISSRSNELLETAIAGGRGLPPSLVIAGRLALSNAAAFASGPLVKPRPFTWLVQAWRGARLAARTRWQVDS